MLGEFLKKFFIMLSIGVVIVIIVDEAIPTIAFTEKLYLAASALTCLSIILFSYVIRSNKVISLIGICFAPFYAMFLVWQPERPAQIAFIIPIIVCIMTLKYYSSNSVRR